MERRQVVLMFHRFTFVTVIHSLLVMCSSTNDYYTSPVGVQKLIKAEQKLLSAASEYATILEGRILKIKRYLEDYEDSVVARMENSSPSNQGDGTVKIYDKESDLEELAEKVAAHPLITYRLLRRFALELNALEKDVNNNEEKRFLVEMEKVRKGLPLPKSEDVDGAIEGLIRVQDAYDLNVTEFSQGNFMGLETNSGLTAADCYKVGKYALQANVYVRAIQWLERAYLMTTLENDVSVSEEMVKKALDEAISQHNKVQKQNPLHMHVFNSAIEPINGTEFLSANLRRAFADRKHVLYQTTDSMMDLWNFAALCSGKVLQSQSVTKRLTCSYEPWKKVPIFVEKVEVLSINPPVVQIYDVMSDAIIERILERAAPFMNRAKVQGSAQQKEVASVVRTSTTTWLRELEDQVLFKIPIRIQGITGLEMLSYGAAEDLQVSSYGIGGHYNPHYDTILDPQFVSSMSQDEIARGDRIATFMFYLTTLETGGGTAFPRLGVVTQAVKGSGVFWYNLSKDGTRHPFSLHGGCPVLYGTKHVANKWIRSSSQMFVKKCSLQREQ